MEATARKVGVEWIDGGAEAIDRLDNGNDIHYVRHGGVYFHKATPRRIIDILLDRRLKREPIRVHYGDVKTGRDWMDEHDVTGQVGCSMGPLKIPLIIPKGDIGGPGMLDDCIVKITSVPKKSKSLHPNVTVFYQHPTYNVGDLRVKVIPETDPIYPKGYRFAVYQDGKNIANFKDDVKVHKYLHQFNEIWKDA